MSLVKPVSESGCAWNYRGKLARGSQVRRAACGASGVDTGSLPRYFNIESSVKVARWWQPWSPALDVYQILGCTYVDEDIPR